MALVLRSSGLEENGTIDEKYTCDGMDVSIPLNWSDPPEGTKSFALIADDPDAPSGNWVHWVVYDLPADARGLAEGVPAEKTLDDGVRQGVNDFRRVGYGGPCPPSGPAHRYVFTLYALNRKLGLHGGLTKHEVLRAIRGHVLAQSQLVGIYKR